MNSAGPKLASTPKNTKAGSKSSRQLGTKAYHAITAPSIRRLMAKSTSATTADEAGMIMRGKYTFPIILALETTLFEASVRIVENKNHGSRPANTIIG